MLTRGGCAVGGLPSFEAQCRELRETYLILTSIRQDACTRPIFLEWAPSFARPSAVIEVHTNGDAAVLESGSSGGDEIEVLTLVPEEQCKVVPYASQIFDQYTRTAYHTPSSCFNSSWYDCLAFHDVNSVFRRKFRRGGPGLPFNGAKS